MLLCYKPKPEVNHGLFPESCGSELDSQSTNQKNHHGSQSTAVSVQDHCGSLCRTGSSSLSLSPPIATATHCVGTVDKERQRRRCQGFLARDDDVDSLSPLGHGLACRCLDCHNHYRWYTTSVSGGFGTSGYVFAAVLVGVGAYRYMKRRIHAKDETIERRTHKTHTTLVRFPWFGLFLCRKEQARNRSVCEPVIALELPSAHLRGILYAV
jgi:hypothetical protein